MRFWRRTAAWTARQLIEAFPEDTAPRFLIRDRDSIYGHDFQRRVAGVRIEEVITAPHSPWQNPYAERVIGSIRRECLDHLIIIGEDSKRRRKARSSQSPKSAGCIIVIDEPHNVSDPVSSWVISIKSMEGLSARADIDVRCRRVTRRRRELDRSSTFSKLRASSIRAANASANAM